MITRVTSFSNFQVSAATLQWIGGREQQEDACTLHPAEASNTIGSFMAVLADGMGGVADGEKASNHLVDSFLCAYAGQCGGNAADVDTLAHCLSYANQSLAAQKQEGRIDEEAGATFIALSISDDQVNWLNVGDSLLYLQQGTTITKINTAHTWQWELDRRVSCGEMTPAEAAAEPGPRHALYSAVCGDDYVEAELTADPPCRVGDRYIIASDGLMPLIKSGWESLLNTPEVRLATPEKACSILMNKLVQLHVPNQDNTSIIIIDILPTEQYSAHHAQVSLIGDRDSQQDNEAVWESPNAMLAVVADGAGGHSGGERASFTAVSSLYNTWNERLAAGVAPDMAAEILREALLIAHHEVIEQAGGNAKFSGKCAIVAVYLCRGVYTVANVGDCRAYLAHKNTWQQLTIDDSLLRILVERGEVTPEEAQNHPDQSVLTQALGATGNVKPHIHSGTYAAADKFLLCCDGLWNQLPEPLWNMFTLRATTPATHNAMLLNHAQQAVLHAAGKSDNVSAIWIHTPPPPPSSFGFIKYIVIGIAAILLLGICFGALKCFEHLKHEEAKLAQTAMLAQANKNKPSQTPAKAEAVEPAKEAPAVLPDTAEQPCGTEQTNEEEHVGTSKQEVGLEPTAKPEQSATPEQPVEPKQPSTSEQPTAPKLEPPSVQTNINEQCQKLAYQIDQFCTEVYALAKDFNPTHASECQHIEFYAKLEGPQQLALELKNLVLKMPDNHIRLAFDRTHAESQRLKNNLYHFFDTPHFQTGKITTNDIFNLIDWNEIRELYPSTADEYAEEVPPEEMDNAPHLHPDVPLPHEGQEYPAPHFLIEENQ